MLVVMEYHGAASQHAVTRRHFGDDDIVQEFCHYSHVIDDTLSADRTLSVGGAAKSHCSMIFLSSPFLPAAMIWCVSEVRTPAARSTPVSHTSEGEHQTYVQYM